MISAKQPINAVQQMVAFDDLIKARIIFDIKNFSHININVVIIYQYACLFRCYYLINYFLNVIFNDDNERLFNTINYYFFHYHVKKKETTYCLLLNNFFASYAYKIILVHQEDSHFFIYDQSLSLIKKGEIYYYVPLLFDGINNNWLRHAFKVICATFFLLSLIPYYCCFRSNYRYYQYFIKQETSYATNYFLKNVLLPYFTLKTSEIKTDLSLSAKWTLWQNNCFHQWVKLITLLPLEFKDQKIEKNIMFRRLSSVATDEIINILLQTRIYFMIKDKLVFIIFNFFFIHFCYRFSYLFLQTNNYFNNSSIMKKIFYGYNQIIIAIQNGFKLLPIINNHYCYHYIDTNKFSWSDINTSLLFFISL